MARYIRTARAEEDLIKIWTYIAQDNFTAADQLLDRIDDVCERLAEFPGMGAARPDLAQRLRYSAIGTYLVLYLETPGGVEIVRVVRGARNLPDLFRD